MTERITKKEISKNNTKNTTKNGTKSTTKNNTKYSFTLNGLNFGAINVTYGFPPDLKEEFIPENTTKIDTIKQEEIFFLDETKRTRKCSISIIDFDNTERKNLCCYWDRNPIPSDVVPIGCPIRFLPNRTSKSYHSEITKEHYTISENVTNLRMVELKNRTKDTRFTLEPKSIYETDGVFCSFNCCMAYILEFRTNPLYNFSKMFLLKVYSELEGETDIIPAPHWRTLKEYGGTLSIDDFRKTFNSVSITDYGTITFSSLGRVYSHQIKF